MSGRIFQLSASGGGVPKLPVREVRIGRLGLEGDVQKHTKIHGGPDRAVCLYALEVICALQAEGHPVYPGALGDNGVWDRVHVKPLLNAPGRATI